MGVKGQKGARGPACFYLFVRFQVVVCDFHISHKFQLVERVELDERTDLYSMGAIYHYCLTGQYPFNGSNAPEVMAAHLQS